MLFNALSIITLVLCFILGIYVYLNNRQSSTNKSFFLLTCSMILWIFCNLMTDLSKDLTLISTWSKATLVGPIFGAYFFYRFCLSFPKRKVEKKVYEIGVIVSILLFLFLIPTKFNISGVYLLGDSIPAIYPGPLYIVFLVYFIVLIFLSFKNLFKGYHSFGVLEKLQVQYISIGFSISIVLGSITDLILPLLNNSDFVNFGPYFILIFIFFTMYAVIKFRMFNIKIVATQVLVFSLWIFILMRALIADNFQDRLIDASLLLLLIIFGLLLIRSVIREVEQRERIEKLAGDLQKANERLTDLDRQKSEFVSFATHQLRAPLTAMKGYASLILEGDMGVIGDEVRQAVTRIFDSSKTLATIVDDYLNVTRIELGTMKYAFDTFDLKNLIEDVIGELGPNLKKDTIRFSFTAENTENDWDWRITADRDKIKQVIANLIDNSVKYTPQGFVRVMLSLNKTKHRIVVTIEDSGIGIAPETLPLLFNKFSRAGNANKTNIKGTGLGLFVAKQIVVAHHGDIRAYSAGEGKGSTFSVEFEPFAKA